MFTEWHLTEQELISEAAILAALEARISNLLLQEPENFWQLLYRLDVSETKVRQAIAEGEQAPAKIARLVYQRQQEKATTRAQYRRPEGDADADLAW